MRVRKHLVYCGAAIVVALAVAAAQADVFNMPEGQTSLSFVTVGDANNVADPATTHGAVNHDFRMGTCDVTVAQYCDFLNAVAKTDTYGLYNGYMDMGIVTSSVTRINIVRSGASGDYSYAVGGSYAQAANCPIFAVGWGDAARFANWLQNGRPSFAAGTPGQVSGSTETGAYTLNGANDNYRLIAVTRNPDAAYFLPSLDEWYKSAYYKGGGTSAGYWSFPTQSNVAPNNVLSATAPNSANYFTCATCSTDVVNRLTPVGAFVASPGAYGTYDQGGNVGQWLDSSLDGSTFGVRGGDWDHYYSSMNTLSSGADSLPTWKLATTGFRLAASVPEPGTLSLLLACAVSLIACALRRKMAS
jgi:formylglycine-generating enzyme